MRTWKKKTDASVSPASTAGEPDQFTANIVAALGSIIPKDGELKETFKRSSDRPADR